MVSLWGCRFQNKWEQIKEICREPRNEREHGLKSMKNTHKEERVMQMTEIRYSLIYVYFVRYIDSFWEYCFK